MIGRLSWWDRLYRWILHIAAVAFGLLVAAAVCLIILDLLTWQRQPDRGACLKWPHATVAFFTPWIGRERAIALYCEEWELL